MLLLFGLFLLALCRAFLLSTVIDIPIFEQLQTPMRVIQLRVGTKLTREEVIHVAAELAVEVFERLEIAFVGALQIGHIGSVGGRKAWNCLQAFVDIGPQTMLAHLVVAAQFAQDDEEAVQVDVNAVDGGHAVHGRATVVHELVELRHEAILDLGGKVVGAAAVIAAVIVLLGVAGGAVVFVFVTRAQALVVRDGLFRFFADLFRLGGFFCL